MMRGKRDWDADRRRFLAGHGWWALGSLWLASVMWAFSNGPRLHALVEQEIAVEEESENRDACRRLGMPFGSERYPACASELDGVRRGKEERTRRHAAGFP